MGGSQVGDGGPVSEGEAGKGLGDLNSMVSDIGVESAVLELTESVSRYR